MPCWRGSSGVVSKWRDFYANSLAKKHMRAFSFGEGGFACASHITAQTTFAGQGVTYSYHHRPVFNLHVQSLHLHVDFAAASSRALKKNTETK